MGEIEITGYKGTGTSIVIPEKIDGKPVRSIAGWAFENIPDVESITIPDSVYRIYGNNFYNSKWYQNLSDGPVYLGNVLHSYKGTAPSSYTVKEGTVSISQSAFSGKTELTSVTLPESLLHIDNYAFSGSGLTGDIVECKKVTKDDFKDSNVLYVRGDYWKYGGSCLSQILVLCQSFQKSQQCVTAVFRQHPIAVKNFLFLICEIGNCNIFVQQFG